MDTLEASRAVAEFDSIRRSCGKQSLHLQVRVLSRGDRPMHIVVSNPAIGVAYQFGRGWPMAFSRDLASGVFG